MDAATWDFIVERPRPATVRHVRSTEVGVIVVNYPGFDDYVRRGALGGGAGLGGGGASTRRAPPLPTDQPGDIAVPARGNGFASRTVDAWMPTAMSITPAARTT